MALRILGEHPLAKGTDHHFRSRIATIFVRTGTLVTRPGTHMTQRLEYSAFLNRQRQEQGRAALAPDEEWRAWEDAVDLIIEEGDFIVIRPDPENMPLALRADELLQDLAPKGRIRFLYARHPNVRRALRARGEYWRISPRPRTSEDIANVIASSRIAIAGRPIYYYNMTTGTRYLTPGRFAALGEMGDGDLRDHLREVKDYAARTNRMGWPELDFFGVDRGFGTSLLAGLDVETMTPAQLRAWHGVAATRFREAVDPDLFDESPQHLPWRNRMFSCLAGEADETVSDDVPRGITPEFFRQIQWLPGARIEDGELIFDPLLQTAASGRDAAESADASDERVKGFICNSQREFGMLEYVNVGRVAPTLPHHPRGGGHRAYVAEIKHRGADDPVVRIIRIQAWGIREHLDEGKSLLHAIMEAEEYTEYILDRRLGCWQLGMPLPGRIETRRITGLYRGRNPRYPNTRVWTTYFERDFIEGVATDKIDERGYRDAAFAQRLARLLGEAAAPNMVVGRETEGGAVKFDAGDEVLVLDEAGMPERIVVADNAGTFVDYESPLESFAAGYAIPVTSRYRKVSDLEDFAEVYVTALVGRLRGIQQTYRSQRRAFDTLFQDSRQGPQTFADRWAKVLDRLDRADPEALGRLLRERIRDALGPSARPAS